MEKAFMAHRDKPLLRGFCNLFERNLTFDLDKQSYVWGDKMRMSVELLQAIESSPLSEDAKNDAVFWAVLFHCTYFVLGYQAKLAVIKDDAEYSFPTSPSPRPFFSRWRPSRSRSPTDAPHWQGNGYEFKPLLQIQASATLETDVLDQLKSGAVSPDSITKIPLLLFSELRACRSLRNTPRRRMKTLRRRCSTSGWPSLPRPTPSGRAA